MESNDDDGDEQDDDDNDEDNDDLKVYSMTHFNLR